MIEPGTLVRLFPGGPVGKVVSRSQFRDYDGAVLSPTFTPYRVRWPSGDENDVPVESLLVVRCANCDHMLAAHTEEGKCLYGPGNWEVT